MNERIKMVLKTLPGVKLLVTTQIWQSFRFRMTLIFSDRENFTFTSFLRLPTQFEALCGLVLNFILADRDDKDIKIAVLGCSNGAEAYSIASTLKNQHPHLRFIVGAYDIDKEMISKARAATFRAEEVLSNKVITRDFLDSTFIVRDNVYIVKKEIKDHVRFDLMDILNPDLRKLIGTFDIVFAQNILVHMKPEAAKKGFINICSLLNPKAALFIDGIDLNIRQRLTKTERLKPLEYKIVEIHDEARGYKGGGWPYIYWGLEPFSASRREWQRRYSTIFLKDNDHR